VPALHGTHDTMFACVVPLQYPESILPGPQEDVQLAHLWCCVYMYVCKRVLVFVHVHP
jgi:hypothetical protein